MASIIVYPSDLSPPQVVPLERRIVRLGSAGDNDIHLSGGYISAHHAHIVYERAGFTISPTDPDATVVIGGKKRKSHKLVDGDIAMLGEHLMRFVLYDQGLSAKEQASNQDAAEDAKRFESLARFSERLMDTWDVDAILERLLDEVIALTDAQKAFVVLTGSGQPRIQVARNISTQSISTDDANTANNLALSDSIVRRVLESGEALIVADALSHDDFKASRSVVDLKLCSVMCVPLKARGTTLGVFYLGNDNAVNHFSDSLLEIVDVFGAQAALILANAFARQELVTEVQNLQADAEGRRFGELIGACDAMRDIFKKISRVATTDISVLIEGETGTGKELVARALHERSNRAKKPFVVINCGAIAENLLESELFGHVRGAFTGAIAAKKGTFQSANGGTLFLDEIGEMPLPLQVKILRAIQERVVTKVGDTRSEHVDIRIVAATNRHLKDEVDAGRFREDLYYRLNVIALTLPPLRVRGDDIPLLANYFLKRHGEALSGRVCTMSSEAINALKRWRWPGNIRELDNRVKKAVIFSDSGIITPEDLDLGDDTLDPVLPLSDAREQWQRDYINRILALNDGNRTKAARDLDVDPRTVFRHLERERTGGE